MPPLKKTHVLADRCVGLTIPELEQSKAAVLSTLRLHIPAGATSMPSRSSSIGIAPSLD